MRHRDLYETMMKRDISSDTLLMLKAMYKECSSKIIMDEHLSKPIRICKGVRQGGSSSPICFNFVPNELAWRINEINIGISIGDAQQKD
ncbi:unnamed protein product [Blepharisma stoltei]|uniref:Reverse transcriptase domain-containing protein n=1 Tax=Blepharisma stoltei TaxID=1481888 RepID=A0AAU9JUB7_9CILI|nr:unnamed protein product [Blepharisma stoltei]